MATERPARWQERTVERSLRGARERAISRGDAFIAAATDLLRTTGKSDFTVQEIVERSGLSLRSFYAHFGSKDDLLLALIEESVRRSLQTVRPLVAEQTDPVAKLRIALEASVANQDTDSPAAPALVLFHWQLAHSRRDEFVATMQPMVELVHEILLDGVADGRYRQDVDPEVLAALVAYTTTALLDARALGIQLTDRAVTPDDVIAWFLAAVGARDAAPASPTRRRGPGTGKGRTGPARRGAGRASRS